MAVYIIRRIISMIPILLIVSILAFLFIHLTPGDPIRIMYGSEISQENYLELRAQMGFDDPLPVQYFRYMGNVMRGDFGNSYRTRSSVTEEINRRFGYTFVLALVSMIWAVFAGLIVGIISAVKRNSVWDRVAMIASISSISMPTFWLGLVLMQVLAVNLGWLPTSGSTTWQHIIMPSIVLGTGVAAVVARFSRSSLLETLGEDYIRTARAKGQKKHIVIIRHALRNALIPVVTMTGLQFGFLIGGSIVIEQVFAWPGLGNYLIQGITFRDYPVVQAMIMLFALQFLVVNLLVDITYAFLNPQIRYD